jgi:hypothetical protein
MYIYIYIYIYIYNQKCHYHVYNSPSHHVYNSPSLIPTLSQNNLNDIPPSHFLKVKFNIIFTLRSSILPYISDPLLSKLGMLLFLYQ